MSLSLFVLRYIARQLINYIDSIFCRGKILSWRLKKFLFENENIVGTLSFYFSFHRFEQAFRTIVRIFKELFRILKKMPEKIREKFSTRGN